jgi:hypothetical protein
MPVELVAAAVLATGYQGPISLEVFNTSLNLPGQHIPAEHAIRGITGLQKLLDSAIALSSFWDSQAERKKAITQVIRRLQPTMHRL